MSSKGKSWEVPHRQTSPALIAEISTLIGQGKSVSETAEIVGKKESMVKTLLLKHTPGIRRLRYNAAQEQGK